MEMALALVREEQIRHPYLARIVEGQVFHPAWVCPDKEQKEKKKQKRNSIDEEHKRARHKGKKVFTTRGTACAS